MSRRKMTAKYVTGPRRVVTYKTVTRRIMQCERPYVLFGEAVRQARHALEWNQQELADKMKMSRGSVANIEYSGYSCNGINIFGDRKSIDAAMSAFHSHGQIDGLKTQLRHWREECGKLHARLSAKAA